MHRIQNLTVDPLKIQSALVPAGRAVGGKPASVFKSSLSPVLSSSRPISDVITPQFSKKTGLLKKYSTRQVEESLNVPEVCTELPSL